MFDVGFQELILILVVSLIVFGPKSLPDFARGLGRAVAEFKKFSNEIKSTIEQDETFREFKREFQSAQDKVMIASTFSNPLDAHPSVTESPEASLVAEESVARVSDEAHPAETPVSVTESVEPAIVYLPKPEDHHAGSEEVRSEKTSE